MFLLEGLRISAQTVGITADTVDKQIDYIFSTLGVILEEE
jgi:hypothetical protein